MIMYIKVLGKDVIMDELTATVAETRAHFSHIASEVNKSGKPVTVFRNSKPWVVIAPISSGYGDHIPYVDWSKQDYVPMDPKTHKTTLPAEWNDPEDEGLYDDLV